MKNYRSTFIVEVKKPEVRSRLEAVGKVGTPKSLDTFYILETDMTLEEVQNIRGVKSVEEDHHFTPDEEVHTRKTSSWGIARMSGEFMPFGSSFEYKKNIDRSGKGVNVYIMDTGIDTSHSSIKHADIETIYSYDDKEFDPSQTVSPYHGTCVCSCIVGRDSNGHNIGTAPEASIKNVRYAYKFSDAIKCYDTILDHYRKSGKHAILNMSFSSGIPTKENLIKQLSDEGIILVASAGNTGSDTKRFPAAFDYTISVGATTRTDRLTSFSTYGDTLDILAPGEELPVPVYPSGMRNGMGTSYSAPLTAGIIATHIQDAPFSVNLTKGEIMDRLTKGSFKEAVKLTSDQEGTTSNIVSSISGFHEWEEEIKKKSKKKSKKSSNSIGIVLIVAVILAIIIFQSL
jgi:hypothetical protein